MVGFEKRVIWILLHQFQDRLETALAFFNCLLRRPKPRQIDGVWPTAVTFVLVYALVGNTMKAAALLL